LGSNNLAYIALGSNQGDSSQIVRRAMDRLAQWSQEPPLRSSLWRSEPVDCPAGSPWFTNAVVCLKVPDDETPESLLEKLQSLEREFGRLPKKERNEPRPLDLDLIAFGAETRDTAALTLPHPRATGRRFVLEPLAEIAPDLILPGQVRTVAELRAATGTEMLISRIEVINSDRIDTAP